MIERIQKIALFEEASTKGIKTSSIQRIPEIFQDILGVTDVGQSPYGGPTMPVYKAQTGNPIEISRMAKYFVGVQRDLNVLNMSLSNLESNLSSINLEIWNRSQLVKNKSKDIKSKIDNEKLRTSTLASWIYTETFNSITNISSASTAWFDTSEGIAFIPSLDSSRTVLPQDITIASVNIPLSANQTGSQASYAFDGRNTTNWRVMFFTEETANIAISFPKTDITSICLDPVGFGLDYEIFLDDGSGFKSVSKDIIYSKSTYSLTFANATGMKVVFKSTSSTLPKIAGFRDITFYTSSTNDSCVIYSSLLKPDNPFSEIKVGYKGTIPSGSSVKFYYATESTGPWNLVTPDSWTSTDDTSLVSINVPFTAATNTDSLGGLYGVSLGGLTTTNVGEGVLHLGEDQVEVTAFKKDWRENGETSHAPDTKDFVNLLRSWSDVVDTDLHNDSLIIQDYARSLFAIGDAINRNGNAMLFNRYATYTELGSLASYKQLCIIPLVGDKTKQRMQYGFNYKMRFNVYCPTPFFYNESKYWFSQGYRVQGARSYREIGKSFVSFSLYINGSAVLNDDKPYTIYQTANPTTGSFIEENGNAGISFPLSFQAGWNVVELMFTITDPAQFGTDTYDSDPYCQLLISPSIFDWNFRNSSEHEITRIVGSGEFKPVTEFDLTWNLPYDSQFWSWNKTLDTILYNVNTKNVIDGYFSGTAPSSLLIFRPSVLETSDLFIKAEMFKSSQTSSSPILDEYNVMTR